MSKISISHIGHAQQYWLRSLDFYKQELGVLKDRLTEIGGKNTSKDIGAQVEHFENRMAVQRDQIDNLIHNINGDVAAMSTQAKQNNGAGYVDQQFAANYKGLQEQFNTTETLVNELRREFNQFSSSRM
jgi:hypothetical protein